LTFLIMSDNLSYSFFKKHQIFYYDLFFNK
jgi:hypothetical protein